MRVDVVRRDMLNDVSLAPASEIRATDSDSFSASQYASAHVPQQPEQFLLRCPTRMVVEHSRSLVEAASMPRIVELELLIIEMMAELVA